MNINGFQISLEIVVIAMIILSVILLVALILSIVSLYKINKLRCKYEQFIMGGNAKSLEKIILDCINEQKEINDMHEKMLQDISVIYNRLTFTVQKVAIHKYDAFGNTGGKLSYSIALLDEKNTGIIITSVHSVEGSYNYAKDIQSGKADVLLTEEELEVLNKACR